MPSVTKSFSFDPEQAPDVAEWFDRLPDYRGAVSEALIRAIRCDIAKHQDKQGDEGDLGEVLKRLERIEVALNNRGPATSPVDSSLPDDVLGALDDLAG